MPAGLSSFFGMVWVTIGKGLARSNGKKKRSAVTIPQINFRLAIVLVLCTALKYRQVSMS